MSNINILFDLLNMGCTAAKELPANKCVKTELINEWESFQKIDSDFKEKSNEWRLSGEQADYKNGFKMTIHQRKDLNGGRKDDIMRGHGSYKGTSVDQLVAFFTKADAFPGM